MNVLFFLTPKSDVSFVDEDDTLRQVLEKMEHHGYSAVPLLSRDGRYIGTLTDGDLLWAMKKLNFPTITELEDISIMTVKRSRDNKPARITDSMETLLDIVSEQNFVPVVDDNKIFIGIVTRRDVIACLADRKKMKT